jgi:glucosamine--fructose-6-phosphate aminotransferase (isomerizing)
MVTVACGTGYYSALVGKFYLEKMARLHVEVDYGSEYRYRLGQPHSFCQTAI